MTKHFVKDGCIEIHGTMSLSTRVETFSRVLTALCFCVVWMCCDFQGLIAFYTLWDEREDSIHCVPLTQGQSAFLYHNILCYAGGLTNAHLLPSERKHPSDSFQQTRWRGAHLPSRIVILTAHEQYFTHLIYFFSIFETMFISRISSSHFNHDWI